MTSAKKAKQKILSCYKSSVTSTLKNLILPLGVLFILIIFLVNSELASTSVKSALGICARSIIPSVFPCMVLSSLIVSLGGGEILGKIFGAPFSYIFGISESASAAFILGLLCGFPVGASSASAMYRNGEIDKSELERILTFVNFPSPAFVINAVGYSALGSRAYGLLLFIITLISSVVVGCASRFFKHTTKSSLQKLTPSKASYGAESIISAIGGASLSMLKICGSIIFFSSLASTLISVLPFNLSTEAAALLTGLLEFSSGCFALSGCKNAFPLCAALLSFSGFCVHIQVISVCDKEVSFKKYFVCSAVRAIVAFLLALAVKNLFLDI